MKKHITKILLGVCLLVLAACGPEKQTDYAAAIMVDGEIYYKSVAEVSEEIAEEDIMGYTEAYTDTFPKKNGESNFDRELGMPYAKVKDGVAVCIENKWYMCFPEGYHTDGASMPETMPEDFSFALTWGCYGISSYDSKTGKLIKTTDATHPEDYITSYELPQEYKYRIYDYIRVLDYYD